MLILCEYGGNDRFVNALWNLKLRRLSNGLTKRQSCVKKCPNDYYPHSVTLDCIFKPNCTELNSTVAEC